MTTGSRIYQRFYADLPPDDLQRRVWDGTPFIVNAFTGPMWPDGREREMFDWLDARLGREAFPFGPEPIAGQWRRGGATVFGWTWFGFADEADAAAFLEAFPSPADALADVGA